MRVTAIYLERTANGRGTFAIAELSLATGTGVEASVLQ
jgi:hypothetical protein